MKSLAEIRAEIELLSRDEQLELGRRLMETIQPNCLELTKDILEEVWAAGGSGLGDLSTNRKYMEGFGAPKRRIWP